jgi:ADP-ribose pyrophosphatase
VSTAPEVEPAGYRLLASREVFTGAIFSVFTDTVELPDGTVVSRDWVRNRGAVVVVALDDAGRVALIRQYRHAVREVLWELPAGLLDVAGEPPVAAAARELAEEVDLVAGRWDHLVDEHASPGFADELVHIYLARELSDVPDSDRHVRDQEEAQLQVRMVDLDDAVAMILRGEITNAAAVIGLLAAARARDQGWSSLRPA